MKPHRAVDPPQPGVLKGADLGAAISSAAERRFSAFMKNLPGAAFLKDAEGRYIEVNSGWEELFGKTSAEALGKLDADIFDPAVAERLCGSDRSIQKRGEAIVVSDVVENQWGRRQVLVTKFPIQGSAGGGMEIGGIVIDVTARQHTEELLRARQEELRQAHERLQFHVNNTPLAIIEWDRDFRIIRWSSQAEVLFGWNESEVIGTHPQEWKFIHPEDAGKVRAAMDELMTGKKQRNHVVNRNFSKDGEIRHLEWYNSISLDSEGKVFSIFSIVHNITEQIRSKVALQGLNAELEARVEQRTEELRASNEELAAFSYSVSHDLRAPLRGIAGFAHALDEEAGHLFDETARKYLTRIQNAASRMGLLIDDLLKLSRLTRAEMQMQWTDFSQLAREVVQEIQNDQQERRVQVVIPEALNVWGDPELLRILLENLISNAWKFTDPVAEPRIEIGGVRDSQTGITTCFVKDNGVGFDMRYVHKLFAPFQRLHSATEFPGTGVGLATVQRIVRRHMGEVSAFGTLNDGAAFTFTLPSPSPEHRINAQ